jgi:hypothetical protein
VIDGVRVNDDGEIIEDDEDGNDVSALDAEDDEADEDGKTLSDLLIRDLTAHRTLDLRLALGAQPDMALIAVTHAFAAQTFYHAVDAHCLEIRPVSSNLGGHADGIEDTAAAKAGGSSCRVGCGHAARRGGPVGLHRRTGSDEHHGAVRALRLADRQCGEAALGAQAPRP